MLKLLITYLVTVNNQLMVQFSFVKKQKFFSRWFCEKLPNVTFDVESFKVLENVFVAPIFLSGIEAKEYFTQN